jgi:DNA-directed RNA polymerase specialized sigma24 family protein
VALSAFDSFCRAAQRGRFTHLDDRNDLWHVLLKITLCNGCVLANHERRASRGAGKVRTISDLADFGADSIVGSEPSPELAAQIADECRRLMGLLHDESLRAVALWKMEGYTNEEIAAKLGCARFTVDRKLSAIRRIWEPERGV